MPTQLVVPASLRSIRLRGVGSALVAALVATLAAPRPSAAEEVCKMEMNVPPMTLSAIYAKAEKIARGWKADAVPARLGNTSLGPLDAAGKSEAWNLVFYSKSADSNLAINTFRGMFTCWADKGGAGRLPDFKPGFLVDGARLYALAKEHGGALIAKGFAVAVQTAASPETRHATWYINFSDPDSKDGGLSIILDANTGKLEDVIRH